MDRWMDGWVDRWMDRWLDGWMELGREERMKDGWKIRE